jgi:hypothetical protein
MNSACLCDNSTHRAEAAPRLLPRLGAFLVVFGVWDIAYYIALYALLRWPPSVATLDLLFLIPPGPWWIQPVWVPVAISCVMIDPMWPNFGTGRCTVSTSISGGALYQLSIDPSDAAARTDVSDPSTASRILTWTSFFES